MITSIMSELSECSNDCQLTNQDDDGMYPTTCAAVHGSLQSLKLLLDHGGLLNDYTIELTAMNGHYECLKLLLDHGAHIGNNATVYATMNGHYECLKLLLDHGAHIANNTTA